MTAGRDARYSRVVMNALQPIRNRRLALAPVLAVLLAATTTAQSAPHLESLSHDGVFQGAQEADERCETSPSSTIDDRIRWLTFYLIYTDDILSHYAPGGAMGARFDLFQFGGFPGAQPHGYPIHIIVRNAHITLMGVVRTRHDKHIAEMRAREVAGVLGVENALLVAQREELP